MTVIHEDVGGHRPSMQTTLALDCRGNNYSKVLDTGRVSARHYSPDIAISRADLHRTCRDVSRFQRIVHEMYMRALSLSLARARFREKDEIFWRRATFLLIMIRRDVTSQTVAYEA